MRYITPEIVMRDRAAEGPAPRWDLAVLCFRDTGSAAMVRRLGATPVGYRTLWGMQESDDCPFVHQVTLGSKRVCVIARCLWGGPQAAILVEELAHLGVEVIIGLGAAGSLVPGLAKGTPVVATAGLVTDGTSTAYTQARQVMPHAGLLDALARIEGGLASGLARVRVATVDAVYRETEEAVQRWLSLGAQAINMETSPLYAAASACGLASVWIGHISDSLLQGEWDSWNWVPASGDAAIQAVAALVEHLAGVS